MVNNLQNHLALRSVVLSLNAADDNILNALIAFQENTLAGEMSFIFSLFSKTISWWLP